MLLFLALLCLGGAVYALGEVATYPARLKARSVKRATDYGHIRLKTSERELVRFRERVLAPTAEKLAAIPVKLAPRTNLDGINAKIVAAGLSQRLSVPTYLALKGGAMVGGCLIGLTVAAAG